MAFSRPRLHPLRSAAFFAEPFAIAASGVVTVQEYGSSPRLSARSVSTKTAALLAGLADPGEAG